ncbi:MAG: ATP synthase alpha chain, partial [uncultured Solirubrobacteraceae bacterium]
RRRRDGRALPLQRQAHALRVRRPDQARVRVPSDVAAAAPPAGPRGVPGRRVLPAQPPARALGQAQRRPRRRLDDRAADHRDAGRRRVGLHPDERHLDHRRADLPRAQAVLLGRAPGDQRRHLGVARGWQRADQADEEGCGPAEARAVAVPRPRGLRAVRIGPRRRHAGHAGARRAAREDAQPEGALADGRRGAGRRDLRRDERLPRSRQRRPRAGVPRGARRAGALRARRTARDDRGRRLERRHGGFGARRGRRVRRRLRLRPRRGRRRAGRGLELGRWRAALGCRLRRLRRGRRRHRRGARGGGRTRV